MLHLKHLGFSFSTIRNTSLDDQSIFVTFDDGYDNVMDHAFPVLREVEGVATVFAIADYVGKKNSWDYFPEAHQIHHMPWGDLRTLSDAGWEIGSHGKTHRRMIHMNPREIVKELEESKLEIEQQTGKEVVTFCPPFNAWNYELLQAIEAAGYTRVAISYPMSPLPKWSGEFVPRLGVYRHDILSKFMGKIVTNPWSPIEVLQQQLINIAGDGHILESWLKPQ
jgi:peptidoglycan/xylan/chitin deacetylase (PgdA/CDA1 family)